MRTRQMVAVLVAAMLIIAACGGESNGPKQGVHDAGGKDNDHVFVDVQGAAKDREPQSQQDGRGVPLQSRTC